MTCEYTDKANPQKRTGSLMRGMWVPFGSTSASLTPMPRLGNNRWRR